MLQAIYQTFFFFFGEHASMRGKNKTKQNMAAWEWDEVLTMQTWISLLAENEGSQVMDTECSKEKFFTMYKRLSCLHTPSTVKPWTQRRNETNLNTHGK